MIIPTFRNGDKRQLAPWRYGPAQYWYDKLGIGESESDFEEQLRKCRTKEEDEEKGDESGANKDGVAGGENASKKVAGNGGGDVDTLIAAASTATPAAKAETSFQYEVSKEGGSGDGSGGGAAEASTLASMEVEYPDAAFHLVTQLQWEDDIIWNGEEYRTKLYQNRHRQAAAGWVPSR